MRKSKVSSIATPDEGAVWVFEMSGLLFAVLGLEISLLIQSFHPTRQISVEDAVLQMLHIA